MKRRGPAILSRRGILAEEYTGSKDDMTAVEVELRVARAVDHVLARHPQTSEFRLPRWRLFKWAFASARRGYCLASSHPLVQLAHEVLCHQTKQPCVLVGARGRRYDVELKLFEGHTFGSGNASDIVDAYMAATGALNRPKAAARGRIVKRPGRCEHRYTRLRFDDVSSSVKDALLTTIGNVASFAQIHEETE